MASQADDLFASVDALAGDFFGESVVYIAASGQRTTDSAALVDDETAPEWTVERGELTGHRGGIIKARERVFGIRRSLVDDPQLNAKIRYQNEDWAVLEVVKKDPQRTYLRCQIQSSRDESKGGIRKQF